MITSDAEKNARDGVTAAVLAYTMWGFLPAYFKITDFVAPMEMLMLRIVWSVPFGALIIIARRQTTEVLEGLKRARTILLLSLAALLIATNWFIYIWAVMNDHIFQASLGYYINPLIYVVVGVAFFGDPLRKLQLLAVVIASAAVIVLAVLGGEFPFIALSLAVSFTGYGIIKKQVNISGMPGLFIETLVLFPLALWFLISSMRAGEVALTTSEPGTFLLLMLAGPVTVLPLLFFGLAARRLRLSTMGFLQFIGPTLQFLLGILYGEQLTLSYGICFVLIWIAVCLYARDAWSNSRHSRRVTTV